jgi:hypothetical protein
MRTRLSSRCRRTIIALRRIAQEHDRAVARTRHGTRHDA